MWGLLREGVCGHLSLVFLFVGVGLNSSGDPDINCSCCHVRLAVVGGRRLVLEGVRGGGMGRA